MSVIVMKKRFETPPSKEEILSLVAAENLGDQDKAKEALVNILAPMKDLLAVYAFLENLGPTAESVSALLREKDSIEQSVIQAREDLKKAKTAVEDARAITAPQVAKLTGEVAELEKRKAALSKSIEDDETAKLRVNTIVSAEYDRKRADMMGRINREIKAAQDDADKVLKATNEKIASAQEELEAMVEKKRAFIASLG